MQANDNNGSRPERTNVASIIAAARRNLKNDELKILDNIDIDDTLMDGESDNVEGEEVEDAQEDDDNDDNDDDASMVSNNNDDDDNNNDSSGDESSDDEVDDVQKAKDMDGDVVREKQSKRKKMKNNRETATATTTEDDNDNDHDDDNDDDDDDAESEMEDSEDEEAKLEAAKAKQFFDSSQQTIQNNIEVEAFAQLNLSRPLLRGVASIGFVTPTPIQTRVIPIALSGRDVCAR